MEVFDLFLFQAGFFVCSYSRQVPLFVLIPGWARCLFSFQVGYFAIYYEYPDDIVEAHKQTF